MAFRKRLRGSLATAEKWLGRIGLFHWLWSLAGATVVTGLATLITTGPWYSFLLLFLGALLVVVAIMVTLHPTRSSAEQLRISEELVVRLTPADGRPSRVTYAAKKGEAREVDFGCPLRAIRFRYPIDRVVRNADVPVKIRDGWRLLLVVAAFTDTGVWVEEAQTQSITLEGYCRDEPPARGVG